MTDDAIQSSISLAAFLGLIEGLTEFLPVSSTGHLIIAGHLLGFTGSFADTFEIAIQLGSILAIIVYERGKIAELVTGAVEEIRTSSRNPGGGSQISPVPAASIRTTPKVRFLLGLGIAFLPAAIVGFLTHHWIESTLFSPVTVAMALIAGGVILLWVESVHRVVEVADLERMDLQRAFLVGVAQCCALFPGISRSGATIVGGMLVGLDRKTATEYSFFLALPTMIVATLYELIKSASLFSADDIVALAVGLVVSFFVAWGVIAAFLTFVKQHTLRGFGYYRIALGVVVLLWFR